MEQNEDISPLGCIMIYDWCRPAFQFRLLTLYNLVDLSGLKPLDPGLIILKQILQESIEALQLNHHAVSKDLVFIIL